MAAPDYVPVNKAERARVYESPPWSEDAWVADRPGDLHGRQPTGALLGNPGPDQGYALKLARRFEGTLTLYEGEAEADAIAGCLTVALKRASLFGRAPVVHDLRLAFTLFGYLGTPEADLVHLRMPLFAAVSNSHHYLAQRRIADLVPESTLRLSPAEVEAQGPGGWRTLVPGMVGGPAADAELQLQPVETPEVAVEAAEPVAVPMAPVTAPPPPPPASDVVPGQEPVDVAPPVSDVVPGQEPVEVAPPVSDVVPGQEPVEVAPPPPPAPVVPGQEPVDEAPPAVPQPKPTPARPMVVRKGEAKPMSSEDEAAVSDLVARAKKALRDQKRNPR